MTLLLTWLGLSIVLIALFWGGSIAIQGWFYSEPVRGLGWRAAVSGSAIALFLTAWCTLDRAKPGRYITLPDFSTYDVKEYDEVTVVRRYKAQETQEVKTVYKLEKNRAGGTRSTDYMSKGKPFTRTVDGAMTVALIIKDGDNEVRFNANLDDKGNYPPEIRFQEEGGSRYIEEANIGRVFSPKWSLLFGNLTLNFLHFALWFALIWLVLRYQMWHALGFAVAFWLTTMLMVQPVLFEKNRKPAPTASPTTSVTSRIPPPSTDSLSWAISC